MITEDDLNALTSMVELMEKIDSEDAAYLEALVNDFHQHQPVLLSMPATFEGDLSPVELEEVIRIFLLMWAWYSRDPAVYTRQVTEQQYVQTFEKNLTFLASVDKVSPKEREKRLERVLDQVAGRPLMAAVILRFKERPGLGTMEERTRGLVLLSIKSAIECLEAI